MLGDSVFISGLETNGLLGRLGGARDVVVIVPVYNGGQVVKRCLDSVLATDMRGRMRILVVDDASSDDYTQTILNEYALHPRVEVLRNSTNLGYTRSVNRGIAEAGPADVILLNSDTEVGPLWVQRLRAAAYSTARVAAVSATSDNAGALAVPEAGRYNDWESEYGWRSTSRAVMQRTKLFTIEAATIHGFCVYLRRDALGDVGVFDEVLFPRGYGEENDWSMRARSKGWTLAIAPQVFVRHQRGASFGVERESLMEQAGRTVNNAWPEYRDDVREWMSSQAMRQMRAHFSAIHDSSVNAIAKPRRAYVVHASGGGTPATNVDLMAALEHDQDSYLFTISPARVELLRFSGGRLALIEEFNARPRFHVSETWRPDLANFLTRVLLTYSIELVHIRHLINQPLETLPLVLEYLGIPFVLSTHDFYYVCPSVNLIDGEGRYCGGVCTKGNSRCNLPSTFVAEVVNLKHREVHTWRDRSRAVLRASDAVVATTASSRDTYLSHFPELAGKFAIIEHGRDDLARPSPPSDVSQRPRGPLRIFCPANWGIQKGSNLVAALIEATSPVVEWHLAGKFSSGVHPLAVDHGPYSRDDFGALVASISPDLGGIFSIAPETFSHTLSELWSMGLPVLATDLGAVGDRIREKGGGFLFPVDRPEDFVNFLLETASSYLRGEGLSLPSAPEVVSRRRTTMAGEYLDLYARVSRIQPPRVVGVAKAAGRGAPYVRIESKVQRYFDDPTAIFRSFDPVDFSLGLDTASYDSLIVQRDALRGADAGRFRREATARGTRIIADFDDDLYSPAAELRVAQDTIGSSRKLLSIADLTVVSTRELALSAKHGGAVRVALHTNLVDESAWEGPVSSSVHMVHRPWQSRAIRWVYWGTNTHAEDLQILRPVFEALHERSKLKIELDVIGVTETDEEWFNRISVPRGSLAYRDFAKWIVSKNRERNWHGGVAPLAENAFNLAKSDLKVLEYTFLNLGSLASNVGPYRLLAARGLKVCENSAESWYSAIVEASSLKRFTPSVQLARYAREERSLKSPGVLESWLAEILPGR